MMTFTLVHSSDGILGPDGLQAASAAFDSCLSHLPEGLAAIEPFALRRLLAGRIIDLAFSGERDPIRLEQAALHPMQATLLSQIH
jgi:hypothetical protein